MDVAHPICGGDHIATSEGAARPVGRDMHGVVGDEAVHGWLKIRKMGLCGEPRERLDFQ